MTLPWETSVVLHEQIFRCSTKTGTSYLQVSSYTFTIAWRTLNIPLIHRLSFLLGHTHYLSTCNCTYTYIHTRRTTVCHHPVSLAYFQSAS